MLSNDIDYFKYVDNFKKNDSIKTFLIHGACSIKSPLVTILIPTYKRSILLKETIDSALNQVNFSDYEVIVLDNDPTLNCETETLVKSYNNERLLYYKNVVNLGMFGNWNRGFELSRSIWTVLLHDDDIISPYFLETCSKFYKNTSIAAIKPELVKFSKFSELDFIRPKKINLERYYLLDFFFGCKIGAPTSILYNKLKIIGSGGFNQQYFPCGDYVSSINLVRSYKVYKLKCILGGYRVNNNESLNEGTMNLYYENRFYISSFIMRYFNVPNFFIPIIQSSLMGTMMRSIESFYNINIKYDYVDKLKLKKVNFFVENSVKLLYMLFLNIINFFRVIFN